MSAQTNVLRTILRDEGYYDPLQSKSQLTEQFYELKYIFDNCFPLKSNYSNKNVL